MGSSSVGAVLLLLAATALPATLLVDRVLVHGEREESAFAKLANVTPLFAWMVVCIIGILNGQNMSPIGGAIVPVLVSYFIFISLMTVALFFVPRSACIFFVMWALFHVTLHPRGRIMRMFRRRGVWTRPLVAMFKFVSNTMIPSVVATLAVGLCVRLGTRDSKACKWLPGLRLFATDTEGTCLRLPFLIPVLLVSIVAAALSVHTHLRATTITRMLAGGNRDEGSIQHMQELHKLVSDAFEGKVARVNPAVALRDQTALVLDTTFAADRDVQIEAALYDERVRQSGIDGLNSANILSKGRAELGGTTRRFNFEETLLRLTQNGGGRGAKAYRWFRMKRAMTSARMLLALSPPRMAFTYEDVYEAAYHTRRWDDMKSDPSGENDASFLVSYLFPAGHMEWMELDKVAVESMRGHTDDDIIAITTKELISSKHTSRFGQDNTKPKGSDAVHFMFFITSLIVPREWTRVKKGKRAYDDDPVREVWGSIPNG